MRTCSLFGFVINLHLVSIDSHKPPSLDCVADISTTRIYKQNRMAASSLSRTAIARRNSNMFILYILQLSGCTVGWKSVKQKIVSGFSTESEYIYLSDASKETLWARNFMNDIGETQESG